MSVRIVRRVWLGFVAAVFLASAGNAQHGATLSDPTTFTVTAESGVPEIPFKLVNNHLILPISVNGSEPLDVVLDTGMPSGGLALFGGAEIESLGLDIDPSIQAQVGGAGGHGKRMSARMAMSESLSVAGLEMDGVRVIVMPEMPDFTGYHHGIIGYSLFGNYVVEIDYDQRVVRLHAPDTYDAPAEAHIVPLTLRNRLPYATVEITAEGGEPFETEVVVDLGASHAISLNTEASDKISIPGNALSAILGHGLSGPLEGQVGRIASLGLGGAQLSQVVATFPVSDHQNPRGIDSLGGNLGSDVLRRFNTTFDYQRSRMILEPNRSFEEPFRFDRSGMRLRSGKEIKVEYVIAGTPAAELGIEVGDQLTHIDGKAIAAGDYGDVRETLMGSGTVRLTLRRGETTLEKTLTLRPLI